MSGISQPQTFSGLLAIIKPSIPFLVSPNFSSNGNGTFNWPTLPSALTRVIPEAFVYVFDANSIVAGTPNNIGWYYTTFATTTTGTFFNNQYTAGVPIAPASPTAFAGAGTGVHVNVLGTPTTAHQYTVAIPMTANGWIDMEVMTSCNNSVGTGTGLFAVTIAGVTVMQFLYNCQNRFGGLARGTVYANGKTNRQLGWNTSTTIDSSSTNQGFGINADSAAPLPAYTIDFSAATQIVTTTILNGTPADVAVLEKFSMAAFV